MIEQPLFGVISKIIDPDLFTVEVDIPGENVELKAFPYRGEVDEPRVGDLVALQELDPIYHSFYLYSKLKENPFIGIRARGKLLKMNADEVIVGIFDPADEDWHDTNDGVDNTPEPTSWLKIDKDGNMDINLETDRNVVIAGNHTAKISGDFSDEISGNYSVKVSGNGTIECSGNCTIKASGNISIEASGNADIKASGSCKINSPQVQITGGQFQMNGTVSPASGPLCAIPCCILMPQRYSLNSNNCWKDKKFNQHPIIN